MDGNPQTLIRVGRFDNSLEDAVKKCTEPLTKVSFGLGNTVKYALFKEPKEPHQEPYLLMVSQQKDKLVTSAGYNVILTVASYSDLNNQRVAYQFQKETGIDLIVKVPGFLKRSAAIMGASFAVFMKNPKEAMDILR